MTYFDMGTLGKSYRHRGGTEPLLGATIPERFSAIVERFPDSDAVVSLPQNRRLRYLELESEIDRVARSLLAAGFRRGDRIGIWSTNNIEWLLLQLASARIGVVLVNLNPAWRARELGYGLQRAAVQGLFMIPGFRRSDYIKTLLALIPELDDGGSTRLQSSAFPLLRRVILFDPVNPMATKPAAAGIALWQDFAAAAASSSAADVNNVSAELDADDPINIQYTSGTTGFAKAVVLSHHNILNNAYFAARSMRFTDADRLAVPVPFYHCFGMVLANLVCVSTGSCIVIPCEHFDARSVLQAIQEERCTAVHGVPTMFIELLEEQRQNPFNLSTLRTGIMAGAPCPAILMESVMRELHCPEILIGYGETETSPLTHLTSVDDTVEQRVNTVGRNLPHQEVKVVDVSSRRTLPIGEVGEICFRGYHVMRGYYDDPGATKEAVDENGWLASGDLGSMDGDGYIRVSGRIKDMIIRGGENIYSREIEDVIFSHPKVKEVAVFGVPDDHYGEQVMTWIQLHPGEKITEEEIRTYCRDRLAHFKVPNYVSFVDEFPTTATGKLQKFRMREIASKQLQSLKSVSRSAEAAP